MLLSSSRVEVQWLLQKHLVLPLPTSCYRIKLYCQSSEASVETVIAVYIHCLPQYSSSIVEVQSLLLKFSGHCICSLLSRLALAIAEVMLKSSVYGKSCHWLLKLSVC